MIEMDTGTLNEVPTEQRLDVDGGKGSDALEGGDDLDAAQEALDNPGEVIDIDAVDTDE